MGTGRGPWWNQRDEKADERREVSAQRKSKGAASPGPSQTPEGSPRPPYVSARVRQEGFSWMEVSVPPKGTGAPGTSSCREGTSQPGRKMLSPAGRPGCRQQPAPHLGYRGMDTFGREGRPEPIFLCQDQEYSHTLISAPSRKRETLPQSEQGPVFRGPPCILPFH